MFQLHKGGFGVDLFEHAVESPIPVDKGPLLKNFQSASSGARSWGISFSGQIKGMQKYGFQARFARQSCRSSQYSHNGQIELFRAIIA
jgi:hypothetical protein